MQIGELSARTGATVRMLRYYDEQGLLQPRRTESGYRIYTEADVDRVARIRCMLSAALPAGVVGTALTFLLDAPSAIPELPQERARLAEVLEEELAALGDKIAALKSSHELLAKILADVQDAVVGPGNPGDPGCAVAHVSVRKAGPAAGVPARQPSPIRAWPRGETITSRCSHVTAG